MRHALRSLDLAAVLVGSAAAPQAVADLPDARIVAHAIDVRFEPATHELQASDRLTVSPAGPARLRFVLASGLEVRSARAGGRTVEVRRHEGPTPHLARFEATLPAGATEVEVAYDGTIFDAVVKKEDLSWVVGDATRGLVSEKGIYLTGGSGWYPRADADTTMRFEVTSLVPAPFLVVTQGKPPQRTTVERTVDGQARAYARAVAVPDLETDGCDLVAGPYVERSREVGGVRIATFFHEALEQDGAADLWLDAAAEVVARYEPILGPYPHSKFDIVANFFSTGYGMPSFTLLGDDVIRYVTAGARHTKRIPPGYLDHEYVHGWFGNGLLVDPRDGNWCEAATTYYSNYLAKELEGGAEGADGAGAVEHRRGVLEKYAIRVTPATDYPVRAFTSKTEDKDNDVGYGKGSLIFHVLRRRLGDDEFFGRVRRFSAERVGTHVSWDDWLTLLDGGWAKPYLERKGLPAVRLVSATTWPADGDAWHVRAEVAVDLERGEAPWPDMDLEVDLDGVRVGTVRVAGKGGVWRGLASRPPQRLELDARCHAMRAIASADLPTCLNRTLEAPGARVVAEDVPALTAVAARIAAGKSLPVATPGDARPGGTGEPAPEVTLVRVPAGGAYRYPSEGEALVEATPTSLRVGTATAEGAGLSALFSPPTRDGAAPRTVFVACDDAALGRAPYLTYYGWDSFVVFQAGRRTPLHRGFFDRTPRGTSRAVGTDPAAVRVAADVERLSSDAMGGRAPGTPGHAAARAYLSDRLEALCGDFPHALVEMPFGLGVADLRSPRTLTLVTADGPAALNDAFRPLGGSPALAKRRYPVPAPVRVTAEGLDRLWRELAAATTPLVLVAPDAAARAALAPFLDTPSSLTEASEAELARPGRDGRVRPRPALGPWISGRRARARPDAGALPVPVLVLSEEAAAAIAARRPTAVEAEVAWDATPGGVNLLAVLPAKDAPAERPPAVLVCAHYDSLGTLGGALVRGADDNASGVACVLEALRGLPEAAARGETRATVLVAFFDGEEWGLVGSRAAAATLASSYDLRAVVAVDSVGRVRDDTVFVIGRSVHGALGESAVSALARAGLRPGGDLDRFAYEHGSDHWPFHERGVPSILCWASDYGVMNTADDEPHLVDPVGVARLATALRTLLLDLAR